MNLLRKVIHYIDTLSYEKQCIKDQAKYQIQFFNCWEQNNEDMYWDQFIHHRHLLDYCPGKKIAIFSVFGRRKMLDKVKADFKVFFSAENVKREVFSQYSDYGLDNSAVDLAIGFDYIDNPRYIRFPLWIDYMFDAWLTDAEIRSKCAALRFPQYVDKSKSCCMVASNPGDGLRKEMYDSLSFLFHVDSAGRYLHNDDSLQMVFGDNKTSYLSGYYFNICPENTDSPGYVTEKVFESLSCGCIPIYWGSCQEPEPEVLNQDAIIFWDRKDHGAAALKQISELVSHPAILREFMRQPRLEPTAEEYILDTFHAIEDKFKEVISK
ncbi:MAG: glycosyltransferase family 10 [Bacteroidales bacterium]|nr:glycosyltransferase family 10 [Bacteroidales bacterium]